MSTEPHKSSLGMGANIWSMLLYLITMGISWISGVTIAAFVFPLIFYFVEKNSGFVKWHAMQATAIYIVQGIIQLILAIITAIVMAATASFGLFGWAYAALFGPAFALSVIGSIVELVFAIFAVICCIKAYQYEEYRMPFFCDIADKLIASRNK